MAIEFYMLLHANLTFKFSVYGHSYFTQISPVSLGRFSANAIQIPKKTLKRKYVKIDNHTVEDTTL